MKLLRTSASLAWLAWLCSLGPSTAAAQPVGAAQPVQHWAPVGDARQETVPLGQPPQVPPAAGEDLAALLQRIHRQLHLAAGGEPGSSPAGSRPAPSSDPAAAAGDDTPDDPPVIDLRFKEHDSVAPDPPSARGDLESRFAASAASAARPAEPPAAAPRPHEAFSGLAGEELRFLLLGPAAIGRPPNPPPDDAEQRRVQLLALFTGDHFVDELVSRESARLFSPRAMLRLATAPRSGSALAEARNRIVAHGIEAVQAARLETLAGMSAEIERLYGAGLARAGEDLQQQERQGPLLHRALDAARDLASRRAGERVQALHARVSAELATALASAETVR
jgi:hypothetical protein